MWGKEGTEDREIIESLMKRIISSGSTLSEKVQLIDKFLTDPPQTSDVSEILTHIILLDTLTNIMVHFNASAAGFTFEGFLAALLSGSQIPAGTSGIQDIIDNDSSPISLKLLTGEGGGYVHGSYRDLVDHFIDPGGLKQDPESRHFVGKAGSGGSMTYVVALKTFREKDIEERNVLAGEEYIRFYQFDFSAEVFLDLMRTYQHNTDLLYLPKDLSSPPDEGVTHDNKYSPLSPEQVDSLNGAHKKMYQHILSTYDQNYASELFADMELMTQPGSRKAKLVWLSSGEPVRKQDFTLGAGDERRLKVGNKTYAGYMSVKESVGMLEAALRESPEKFWALIARTAGYEGDAGETQFTIPKSYYQNKFYDQDGFGYVGQISVGREAVTKLAEKYVDVLNQSIFDIFKQVEDLTNQINSYFVAGDKPSGLAASNTASDLSVKTKEHVDSNAF